MLRQNLTTNKCKNSKTPARKISMEKKAETDLGREKSNCIDQKGQLIKFNTKYTASQELDTNILECNFLKQKRSHCIT